jgi:hypothetical protein
MLFFSLRFGKKQRTFLAAICCGAAVFLAGWGLTAFNNRTSQKDEAMPVSAQAKADIGDISVNEGRLAFLQDLGYQTEPEPEEIIEVLIPGAFDTAYENYNALQKQQGYDLEKYKGKKVKRYRYKILNYPGKNVSAEATLLIYKGEVIGGDITIGGEVTQVRELALPDGT